MIPMACPSCGRRGNVPLDRLNTRMHCKKCDAVFHLDASGKPILGEPPAARRAKGGGRPGARAKNEPLDPIGIVATKIANLPRGVWYLLGTLLGAYLIYFAYQSYGPQPLTRREMLIEQSVAAATAFLNQKLLHALFGEAAMVEMIDRARRRLSDELAATFAEDRGRFERLAGSAGELRPLAAELRTAADELLPE